MTEKHREHAKHTGKEHPQGHMPKRAPETQDPEAYDRARIAALEQKLNQEASQALGTREKLGDLRMQASQLSFEKGQGGIHLTCMGVRLDIPLRSFEHAFRTGEFIKGTILQMSQRDAKTFDSGIDTFGQRTDLDLKVGKAGKMRYSDETLKEMTGNIGFRAGGNTLADKFDEFFTKANERIRMTHFDRVDSEKLFGSEEQAINKLLEQQYPGFRCVIFDIPDRKDYVVYHGPDESIRKVFHRSDDVLSYAKRMTNQTKKR